MAKKAIRCCICSKIMWDIESNNPWPVRPYSSIGEDENRCCAECNNTLVLPIRIGLIAASESQVQEIHQKLNKMDFYEISNMVADLGLPQIEIPE